MPSPDPVRLALKQLGVSAAWLIGDTPDDIAAARAARVVPIGIPPPGDGADETVRCAGALAAAGAATVLGSLCELEDMLP